MVLGVSVQVDPVFGLDLLQLILLALGLVQKVNGSVVLIGRVSIQV